MKKGIIQNLIIIVLIFSAAILTLRLWSVAEGSDYAAVGQLVSNFFEEVGNTVADNDQPNTPTSIKDLLFPQDIMLNTSESTRCFYNGTAARNAYESVKSYVFSAFSSHQNFEIVNIQWDSILGNSETSGFLLDYGTDIPYQLLSFLAGEKEFDQMGSIYLRYVYITFHDEKITVYFEDCTTSTIYKAAFSPTVDMPEYSSTFSRLYNNTPDLYNTLLFSRFTSNSQIISSVQPGLSPAQKCRLSPTAGAIRAQNPLYSEETGSFNPQPLHNILKTFGFNPSSISRYSEKDGAIVYVENFSSIHISTKGELQYNTSATDKGISVESLLPVTGEKTASDMIAAACSFLNSFDSSVAGGNAQFLFRCAVYDKEARTYLIDFDYIINGIDIPQEKGYGARVELSGGFISKVEISFISYTQVQETFEQTSFEKALMILLSKHGSNLNAVIPIYRSLENSNVLIPVWVGLTK